MKKLLLLFFLSIAFGLKAQVKGFVGIKGGGQLSSAYIEHTLDNLFIKAVPIPGYHMGVTGKLFTFKRSRGLNAGLQLSALYMQKGWKQQFPTEEPSFTTRMSYLEVPAEAVIYGGWKNTKVFFTLGMYYEYLLSLKQEQFPDLNNIGRADFFTYREERDKKMGYGGRASVGMWHSSKAGTFQLEAFMSYSVSNMINYDSFDSGIPDLSNHFAGGFSIAYLIPFGKMDF